LRERARTVHQPVTVSLTPTSATYPLHKSACCSHPCFSFWRFAVTTLCRLSFGAAIGRVSRRRPQKSSSNCIPAAVLLVVPQRPVSGNSSPSSCWSHKVGRTCLVPVRSLLPAGQVAMAAAGAPRSHPPYAHSFAAFWVRRTSFPFGTTHFVDFCRQSIPHSLYCIPSPRLHAPDHVKYI